MGCSVAMIQSIEAGPQRRKLSPRLAHQISRTTGVSAKWLLAGKPKRPMTAAGSGELYDWPFWQLYRKGDSQEPSPERFAWGVRAITRMICDAFARTSSLRDFEFLEMRLRDAVNSVVRDCLGAELPADFRPPTVDEIMGWLKTAEAMGDASMQPREQGFEPQQPVFRIKPRALSPNIDEPLLDSLLRDNDGKSLQENSPSAAPKRQRPRGAKASKNRKSGGKRSSAKA